MEGRINAPACSTTSRSLARKFEMSHTLILSFIRLLLKRNVSSYKVCMTVERGSYLLKYIDNSSSFADVSFCEEVEHVEERLISVGMM